jgi:hypothetical protein
MRPGYMHDVRQRHRASYSVAAHRIVRGDLFVVDLYYAYGDGVRHSHVPEGWRGREGAVVVLVACECCAIGGTYCLDSSAQLAKRWFRALE